MGKQKKKTMLLFTIVMSMMMLLSLSETASAKSKVKLSTTKKTLEVGQSFTLKLQNNNSKDKVKWSVSNGKVKITKSSKKQAKIKAVKKGTSTVKVKVGKKTYKCKVTVNDKKTTVDDKKVTVDDKKTTADDEKVQFNADEALKNIACDPKDTGKGVIAILQNNNSFDVKVSATIVYYYGGKMIDTSKDDNYAFHHGTKCALYFYPPTDGNYHNVSYDDYKITLTVENGTNLVSITDKITTNSNFGSDNVTVEVKNTSKQDLGALGSVQIAVVFYDESGNAIGYDCKYAQCEKQNGVDYLSFDFPYDRNYNTIYPASYEVFVNNAYTYTWALN